MQVIALDTVPIIITSVERRSGVHANSWVAANASKAITQSDSVASTDSPAIAVSRKPVGDVETKYAPTVTAIAESTVIFATSKRSDFAHTRAANRRSDSTTKVDYAAPTSTSAIRLNAGMLLA
jgi:hypothetical protein